VKFHPRSWRIRQIGLRTFDHPWTKQAEIAVAIMHPTVYLRQRQPAPKKPGISYSLSDEARAIAWWGRSPRDCPTGARALTGKPPVQCQSKDATEPVRYIHPTLSLPPAVVSPHPLASPVPLCVRPTSSYDGCGIARRRPKCFTPGKTRSESGLSQRSEDAMSVAPGHEMVRFAHC